jgi:hypothetical protein
VSHRTGLSGAKSAASSLIAQRPCYFRVRSFEGHILMCQILLKKRLAKFDLPFIPVDDQAQVLAVSGVRKPLKVLYP